MFRTTKLYTCMAVVLAVICVIFLSNCGGGGNSAVVPNTNPTTENPVSYTNPTPTPVLSNVNVSGYLYVNNTLTEDGETVPSISVLDIPACQSDSSGNESFLTQFSNSIKADYPEDWVKPEVQELYAQLNKTLSESKPLPEYNAQAQLCSAYDNTSIPVGSDGHFDNTVLTGSSDSNVRLEVALGEDNYAEVETLPSSGSINSSDATGAAELKSCPEKIFAFPGEIIIFKVYAEPGINLKSAGLKFTLNNTSIGCITQPVYLCLFGAHKYQVAYGCVYIKPGLDTPVDTTITAKLNSGQSMNIFLEVIKKTASVSGTVYTGGSPLVKGYVKSLGPKACCKIDASGNYSLPKVFRGHSRSIIATWWTSENGQKIRHREEKVIDFLNADVNGFNFGVPPTPTPTFTPSITPTMHPLEEHYYERKFSVVSKYYDEWEFQLGREEAVQNTIQWLNGNLSSGPSIPEGIVKAYIEEFDESKIIIEFNDGMIVAFDTVIEPYEEVSANPKQNIAYTQSFPPSKSSTNVLNASENICFDPNIIMLSPMNWEYDRYCPIHSVSGQHGIDKYGNFHKSIVGELAQFNYYNVTNKITKMEDIDFNFDNPVESDPNGKYDYNTIKGILSPTLTDSALLPVNLDRIVIPQDYEKIGDYGLVYMQSHGGGGGIYACVLTVNHPSIHNWWVTQPCKTKWFIEYKPYERNYLNNLFPDITEDDIYKKGVKIPMLVITYNSFFADLNANSAKDFKGSIIFNAACHSGDYNYGTGHLHSMKHSQYFSSSTLYFGFDSYDGITWSSNLIYYLLHYMLFGHDIPTMEEYNPNIVREDPPFPKDVPLSAQDSYYMLNSYYNVNDGPRVHGEEEHLKYYPPMTDKTIYFPAPAQIVVHKK